MRPWVVLAIGIGACGRPCSGTAPTVADATAPDAGLAAAGPPRCKEAAPPLRVASAEQTVVLGTAALAGGQVVLGLSIGGRANALLHQGASLRIVDLGPLGDADAPPTAVADGPNAFVAFAHGGPTGRVVSIHRLTESAGPLLAWRVPIQAREGDPVELDVAIDRGEGLAVWTAGDRIHAVGLRTPDAGAERSFSPSSPGDVEAPRVLPAAGGHHVAYLVKQAALAEAAAPWWDKDAPPEGPAERLARGWIEIVRVDPDGRPSGAPVAVTPRAEHVTDFDWGPTSGGVDVLARSAAVPTTGPRGGTLALVRVREGAPAPAVTLAAGLGGGAPVALPTPSGVWAAFWDPNEHVWLVPPAAEPREEPALEGARPVALLPAGPELRLVAVRPGQGGRGADLVVVRCPH